MIFSRDRHDSRLIKLSQKLLENNSFSHTIISKLFSVCKGMKFWIYYCVFSIINFQVSCYLFHKNAIIKNGKFLYKLISNMKRKDQNIYKLPITIRLGGVFEVGEVFKANSTETWQMKLVFFLRFFVFFWRVVSSVSNLTWIAKAFFW